MCSSDLTLVIGTSTSGTMVYAGSTTINAGLVQTGVATVVPQRSAFVVASGAAFDINNFAQTIGSLTGAGTVRNSSATATTLTIGRDDTSTTFGGVFAANTIANLALAKIGAGTLTLNSANDSLITGALTLSGGTLLVDFANVAAPATYTTSAAEIGRAHV